MPYDNVDAFMEIQDLKAAVRELQEKIFPEKFKQEKRR